MKHIMFCISGFSGSGKDEFGDQLIKSYGAVKIGLTDAAKRSMVNYYDFTRKQLFGPSKYRNEGDARYPKNAFFKYGFRKTNGQVERQEIKDILKNFLEIDNEKKYVAVFDIRSIKHGFFDTHRSAIRKYFPFEEYQIYKVNKYEYCVFIYEGDPNFWLSPREALQKYCGLMNDLYEKTWVNCSLSDHLKMVQGSELVDQNNVIKNLSVRTYDQYNGFNETKAHEWKKDVAVTCCCDIRHWHEINGIKERAEVEDFKPIFIRVKRAGIESPPYNHRSETEQATIPDCEFDIIIHNDSSLENYIKKVQEIINELNDTNFNTNGYF